jgi:hypothetical protein
VTHKEAERFVERTEERKELLRKLREAGSLPAELDPFGAGAAAKTSTASASSKA